MAVALRATSTRDTGQASNISVPAGTVAGDVIVVEIFTQNSAPTLTGFTKLHDSVLQSGYYHNSFYRVATGSEGGSTVSCSTNVFSYVCASYSGGEFDSSVSSRANSGGTMLSGTVTPSANDCMLVYTCGTWDANGSTQITAPSGMTRRASAYLDYEPLMLADQLLSGGSGVGVTRSTTNPYGSGNSWTTTLISIKPAGGGAEAQELTLPHISSTATQHAPTVAPGAAGLTLPLIASGSTLHAQTVSPGAVALSLPHISSTATLHAPSVEAPSQSLTLPTIASGSTTHAPTVAPGAVNLSLPTISESTTFAPSVSPGAVALTIPTIASGSTLHAPTVAQGAVTLTLPHIASTADLHEPSVTTTYELALPTIASGAVLYDPTVVLAGGLALPLLESTATLHAPSVAPGSVSLTLPHIDSTAVLHELSISDLQSVTLPHIDSVAVLHEPSLDAAGILLGLPPLLSGAVLHPPVLTGSGTTRGKLPASYLSAATGAPGYERTDSPRRGSYLARSTRR